MSSSNLNHKAIGWQGIEAQQRASRLTMMVLSRQTLALACWRTS
jgi:hypothetical protein